MNTFCHFTPKLMAALMNQHVMRQLSVDHWHRSKEIDRKTPLSPPFHPHPLTSHHHPSRLAVGVVAKRF